MAVAVAPNELEVRNRTPRESLIPLAAILVLGLGARLWGLQAQSLSMDEVYDLRLASQSVGTIVAAEDGFPPLYHLIAHTWLQLVDGAMGLRVLSVILGLAAIVVVWRLGRLAGEDRAGLLAAFFLAISPVHVWYSQEARAYSLYILLAASCIWLFYTAWDTDRPRAWFAYVLVGTLALYTHYYSSILIGALLTTAAMEVGRRPTVRRAVWAHLGMAVLAAPMLLLVSADLQVQQSWGNVRHATDLVAIAYAGFTLLGGYSLGPSLRELHYLRPAEAVRSVLPWAILLGSAALFLASVTVRDPGLRTWTRRFGFLALVPLLVAAALDWSLGTGFRARYIVWCAVPLIAFLAIGVARQLNRRAPVVACAVLGLVALVAVANRRLLHRHMNEDARDAAQYLAAAAEPDAPIFVASWYMASPLRYYLDHPGITPIKGVARTETVADMIRQVQEGANPNQRFWLVYSRPFDGDPKGMLLDSLRRRAGLTKRAEMAGMEVFEGRGF